MYAGTSLTRLSGRLIGAHQKIDRVARLHLGRLTSEDIAFPAARKILQFEGKRGPDALKRKSPAQDEPWHFFDPFDDADTQLLDQIQAHYNSLVEELKAGNSERSAFEAAWLAHAVVDGLTPAHHYPYEEKLSELMGGEGIETRTTIKAKVVMPGENRREQVKNNWLMWGPRGLLLGHTLFEFGIATILAPLNFTKAMPTKADLKRLEEIGILQLFKETAREIAEHDLYSSYTKHGWTPRLVQQVRWDLGPQIVRTVTLIWFAAAQEAKLT